MGSLEYIYYWDLCWTLAGAERAVRMPHIHKMHLMFLMQTGYPAACLGSLKQALLALDHLEGPRRLRGKPLTGAGMLLRRLRRLQQHSGVIKADAHGVRKAGQIACQLEGSQRLLEVHAGGTEGRLAHALCTGAAAAAACSSMHRWIARAAAVFSTGGSLLRILIEKALLQKPQESSVSACASPNARLGPPLSLHPSCAGGSIGCMCSLGARTCRNNLQSSRLDLEPI